MKRVFCKELILSVIIFVGYSVTLCGMWGGRSTWADGETVNLDWYSSGEVVKRSGIFYSDGGYYGGGAVTYQYDLVNHIYQLDVPSDRWAATQCGQGATYCAKLWAEKLEASPYTSLLYLTKCLYDRKEGQPYDDAMRENNSTLVEKFRSVVMPFPIDYGEATIVSVIQNRHEDGAPGKPFNPDIFSSTIKESVRTVSSLMGEVDKQKALRQWLIDVARDRQKYAFFIFNADITRDGHWCVMGIRRTGPAGPDCGPLETIVGDTTQWVLFGSWKTDTNSVLKIHKMATSYINALLFRDFLKRLERAPETDECFVFVKGKCGAGANFKRDLGDFLLKFAVFDTLTLEQLYTLASNSPLLRNISGMIDGVLGPAAAPHDKEFYQKLQRAWAEWARSKAPVDDEEALERRAAEERRRAEEERKQGLKNRLPRAATLCKKPKGEKHSDVVAFSWPCNDILSHEGNIMCFSCAVELFGNMRQRQDGHSFYSVKCPSETCGRLNAPRVYDVLRTARGMRDMVHYSLASASLYNTPEMDWKGIFKEKYFQTVDETPGEVAAKADELKNAQQECIYSIPFQDVKMCELTHVFNHEKTLDQYLEEVADGIIAHGLPKEIITNMPSRYDIVAQIKPQFAQIFFKNEKKQELYEQLETLASQVGSGFEQLTLVEKSIVLISLVVKSVNPYDLVPWLRYGRAASLGAEFDCGFSETERALLFDYVDRLPYLVLGGKESPVKLIQYGVDHNVIRLIDQARVRFGTETIEKIQRAFDIMKSQIDEIDRWVAAAGPKPEEDDVSSRTTSLGMFLEALEHMRSLEGAGALITRVKALKERLKAYIPADDEEASVDVAVEPPPKPPTPGGGINFQIRSGTRGIVGVVISPAALATTTFADLAKSLGFAEVDAPNKMFIYAGRVYKGATELRAIPDIEGKVFQTPILPPTVTAKVQIGVVGGIGPLPGPVALNKLDLLRGSLRTLQEKLRDLGRTLVDLKG